MEAYIQGKPIKLSPAKAIGKGGEADIYDIGNQQALKLFKPPEHPDFSPFPEQQKAAALRIAEHQQKLPAFPRSLPARVIAPLELATKKDGITIIGYAMPILKKAEALLCYGDKTFRQRGVPAEAVIAIFLDLHLTVAALHHKGIVIGDFNDLNVLVKNAEAYLIDADSFQFSPFLCRVYTERFVDPILCDPTATRPLLAQAHNPFSDWYAYEVMLFRSLLLVDPYGGIFKPNDPKKRLPHAARPLHRITVFDPAVVYPKPAWRYDILPDELLQHFHATFAKDQRGVFPQKLLERLNWQTCPSCGLEHARANCPACSGVAPQAVTSVVTVHGQVVAEKILHLEGLVLRAAAVHGKLTYLSWEHGIFRRESRSEIFSGQLTPGMHFRLIGDKTLVAQGNRLIIFKNQTVAAQLELDSCQDIPAFDTCASTLCYVQNGQLLRDGSIGAEYIGDVLPGQTRIWIGDSLGFGFSRAGNLTRAFIFSPHSRGINDGIAFPPISGQLLSMHCHFAGENCWIAWETQDSGQHIAHLALLNASGEIAATQKKQLSEAPWMSGLRGALAMESYLLAPTDEGIVRVEPLQGTLMPAKTFADTEPFVNSGTQLLSGRGGLYAVHERSIYHLKFTAIPD